MHRFHYFIISACMLFTSCNKDEVITEEVGGQPIIITYLMGGTYEQITFAVQNMIANLTGMICDGAKPSCALKLSSGVSTAVFSAILAMEHKCVSSVEGIIDNDVDRSIRNLTRIGSQGMNETDKLVLDIMTH